MPYSPLLVRPMKDELTSIGFQELLTAADVDAWFAQKTGTALLFINSVRGVAAGIARPGARLALERSPNKPNRLGTVFADQDLEATARTRNQFPEIPPSDPSIALFKDGELVFFMPAHRIEGRDADQLAGELESVFAEFCS